MSLGEKYIDSAAKNAGAVLSEPVLHTLFASRPGSMAAGLTGAVTGWSRMAPRDAIHREGAKDTKLPQSFLLVVTPSTLHVFAYKMFWGKTKVKKELGSFPRAGLEMQTNDGSISQFVIRSLEPPQVMSFEAARWGKRSKEVIDRMADLLRDAAAA